MSDVLHISTTFDESVHEYQFARSHPQLFAQLQQLTAAKYPLSPLYIHYTDEDGDMVRVTNEAELREAVRVCGSRLKLVLSSGLPSSTSFSSSSSSPAPHQLQLQQQSIASPTVLSQTPSPSPSLTSASPLPTSSAVGASGESIDDIDDYLSSDEEELFEQARSQVRSQLSQQLMNNSNAGQAEAEAKSPRYGVVALDSDEDEDEEAKVEQSTTEQPGASRVPADATLVAEEPVAESEPAVQPHQVSAVVAPVAGDKAVEVDEQLPAAQMQEDSAAAALPTQPASSQPVQPAADSISQSAAVSEAQVEEKGNDEDGVEAINARLRSWYQLDQQRRDILSSATTTASPPPLPLRPPSPVSVASLFTSFFAEPDVIATIRDNAALLTPLMASSFPVFLHQLCLLNPALSSHPLTRYTFSVSSLHPFTVCVHCSASPVIGRLLHCTICDVTLCGACKAQHPVHRSLSAYSLIELGVSEYRRDTAIAATSTATSTNASSSGSAVRMDDSGRVLEERKASDFAELSDRMRAGGQRVWKQGAVSLRKVDEMLTQFAADIKRMIDSMLDGVFSDSPKPAQQQQQQSVDEQKQPIASPRSRQQQTAGCNVRRAPCLPVSRPNTAPPADAREAGVAMAQPARQSMAAEARADDKPRPQQQQASAAFAYRAQLDLMGDMGLIKSAVDEQTCKELLTASKGNVEQAVQWLMDKINV